MTDFGDAFSQDLRRSANRMEVNTPEFLAGSQCAVAHSSFANHGSQSKFLDNLPLIRFLTNRCSGAGGCNFPFSLLILKNHRSAVINDSISQINFRREFAPIVQILVDDIASREENTGDLDFLTDFQTADLFLGEWTG
jgi:hypothetical protein